MLAIRYIKLLLTNILTLKNFDLLIISNKRHILKSKSSIPLILDKGHVPTRCIVMHDFHGFWTMTFQSVADIAYF